MENLATQLAPARGFPPECWLLSQLRVAQAVPMDPGYRSRQLPSLPRLARTGSLVRLPALGWEMKFKQSLPDRIGDYTAHFPFSDGISLRVWPGEYSPPPRLD